MSFGDSNIRPPPSLNFPLALYQEMAHALRFLALDAVEKAQSGHPGLPMGAADVVTILFAEILKYDPSCPDWPDRDRFVLSAGHGSMLLYALLYLIGSPDISLEDIENFRQLGSKTPGHPEWRHPPGIEMTTGPLGQGFGASVGMALAERLLAAEFSDFVDHYTYVLVSDGDLMEGLSQEALAIAGHLKLRKLIVLFDDNGISIDGPISLTDSTDHVQRFAASGWAAQRIDGHDPQAILNALRSAKVSDRPTFIACKTTIGFGAPTRAGTSRAHGEPLGASEILGTRQKLNWPWPPFVVPDHLLEAWRNIGQKNKILRQKWEESFSAGDSLQRQEFTRRFSKHFPEHLPEVLQKHKAERLLHPEPCATRRASGEILKIMAPHLPELLLGSADLTPSNNTKVVQAPSLQADNFSGRYVHWGIREHGMAAALNGLAVHGGFLPCGGSFLTFTDYCRPSIRLAAMMELRIIYIMTHDSIGLGEDGPTHQPVEHLASFRAMPGILIFRPADSIETLECWQQALSTSGPSILSLTRQNVPCVRNDYVQKNLEENLCARGAYELKASRHFSKDFVDVTLFASGSEVSLALRAWEELERQGHSVRVISVPCLDLFLKQETSYQESLCGPSKVKIAIEAAVQQSWDKLLGENGIFIGMKTFGASGPAADLFEHFSITAAAIVHAAQARLKQCNFIP